MSSEEFKVGDLVAVYGTLKHDGRSHHILSSCRLHSVEKIEGYRMYDLGAFPAVVKSGGENLIHIEVYQTDDSSTLWRLDALEGYPDMYNREKIKLKDGREAWIYFMEGKELGGPIIETGEW